MIGMRVYGATLLSLVVLTTTMPAPAAAEDTAASNGYSVGPQYDTTHVYVAPADFHRFVHSFSATFGGTTSKQGVFQVTPTPSQTMSQLALSPEGAVSVFGFKTPIPYPFGTERTGYLVTNLDAAVTAARKAGAEVRVQPFSDPIGRDAIIQWPGGVVMQLYWHTKSPSYKALTTVPDNRVYLSPDRADTFLHDWLAFSRGRVVSDDRRAPGLEIGRPGETYRRVRVTSGYGNMLVMVTDGHVPWPYGREMTGYQVADLKGTLDKVKSAGVRVLIAPHAADGGRSAMLRFPGGYIAVIHSGART